MTFQYQCDSPFNTIWPWKMSQFLAFFDQKCCILTWCVPSFQVGACFVFICVLSSLHTSQNLNYTPQVPMWHRFKICPTCPFSAIFGLISHMILHRTTLTPVLCITNYPHFLRASCTMSIKCSIIHLLWVQGAYFSCKSWYPSYTKIPFRAISSDDKLFLATTRTKHQLLNPPLSKPEISLRNSQSFEMFNYFLVLRRYST